MDSNFDHLFVHERKNEAVHRRNMVAHNLKVFDVEEADELEHLITLLDQIEEIINTPFKG